MADQVLIDRKATRERIQLDDASWVDIVRGFAPQPGGLFDRLHSELPWVQHSMIREGRRVDEPRLAVGLGNEQMKAYPILHRARLVLEARYRVAFRGAGLILYRDGQDSMGYHSDDEMRYLDRTIVAGLGLGSPRPVGFRRADKQHEQHVAIADGDLYVMGGRCQADWHHGIPKVESCGPRISVVWRWTSKQGPPSSSPTRFVADAPKRRYFR